MIAKVNIEFDSQEKALFDGLDILLKRAKVVYKNEFATLHIEIIQQLLREVKDNRVPQTEEEISNLKAWIKEKYHL